MPETVSLPTVEIDVEPLETALWVLVGLSLVADIVTTMLGLHVGLEESNPIARSAIEGWGLAGMLLLKAIAVAVGLVCRPLLPITYRPIVPAGLALPWTFAAAFNVVAISATV